MLAVAMVTGCDSDPITSPPTNTADHEWFGWFEWAPDWSHLRGQAGFFWDTGADIIVAVAAIEGDESGSFRRWHLENETCSSGGEVMGNEEDYPPLVVDNEGKGVAVAFIRMDPDPSAAYHVKLYQEDAVEPGGEEEPQIETPMACANLTLVPVR